MLSVDGGSSYLTASDSYTALASSGGGAGDASRLRLYYTGQGNTTSDAGFCADVNLNFPHINAPTYVFGNGMSTNSSGTVDMVYDYSGGKTKAATIVNAIKFSYSSGNIASGSIHYVRLRVKLHRRNNMPRYHNINGEHGAVYC